MADRPKILVVDDELDMRIFIATLLKTSGFEPLLCKDGDAGIRKAREERPALILLDVMMPGDGGVKMYRNLKADPALTNVPVLMLTGVQQTSFSHYIRMLTSRLGEPVPEPDAYVEKPPDPAALLKTIRTLLPET